jgi:hypothetical protein
MEKPSLFHSSRFGAALSMCSGVSGGVFTGVGPDFKSAV